ncbi:hypothetical protein ACFLTX_02500 [Chloroflexota bacterium]
MNCRSILVIILLSALLVGCSTGAATEEVQPTTPVEPAGTEPPVEPSATTKPADTATVTLQPLTDAIVFTSNRGTDPDKLGLYLLNLETLEVTPIDTGMDGSILPRWSPDGSTILFSVIDIWNLYSIQPNGGGLTRLTDFRSNNADWSPDGDCLVFQSDHDDEPLNTPDIYIIDIDGTNLVEIQDVPPEVDFSPRWSPDGSRILFISSMPGILQPFAVNPDGTGLTMLMNDPAGVNVASWSPDGKRIVFASGQGDASEIYIVDADGNGSNLVQLTNDAFMDDNPVFSPDGEYIVFSSTRGGNLDLWTMKVNGTDLVQLTNDPYTDSFPDWRQ